MPPKKNGEIRFKTAWLNVCHCRTLLEPAKISEAVILPELKKMTQTIHSHKKSKNTNSHQKQQFLAEITEKMLYFG